jgi:broad specificity phosphatase PhoE
MSQHQIEWSFYFVNVRATGTWTGALRRVGLTLAPAISPPLAREDAPGHLLAMSSPIRLFLARHGRTEWNLARRFQGHTDVPLDDHGRAQAHALGELLRGRIEAVISSDLARASESARIIATSLELPLLALDPDLRERSFGIFEGLTRDECIARHPEIWAAREGNRNFIVPGGEAPEAVVARVQRALARSVTRLRGTHQSALVLSHGSSLRMFLETISGRPEQSFGNTEFRELVHDDRGFSLHD